MGRNSLESRLEEVREGRGVPTCFSKRDRQRWSSDDRMEGVRTVTKDSSRPPACTSSALRFSLAVCDILNELPGWSIEVDVDLVGARAPKTVRRSQEVLFRGAARPLALPGPLADPLQSNLTLSSEGGKKEVSAVYAECCEHISFTSDPDGEISCNFSDVDDRNPLSKTCSSSRYRSSALHTRSTNLSRAPIEAAGVPASVMTGSSSQHPPHESLGTKLKDAAHTVGEKVRCGSSCWPLSAALS